MANETNRSAQRPTAQPDFNVSQKTAEMGVSENKYIIADERKKLFEINERLKKITFLLMSVKNWKMSVTKRKKASISNLIRTYAKIMLKKMKTSKTSLKKMTF